MKRSTWFILGFAFIAVLLSGVYLYGNLSSEEATRGPMRYKEFPVRQGSFVSSVSASGVVLPIDRVQIKSKASGLVEELPVEEGDIVARGDLICRLDQTDVRAEVEQSQADLDIALAELRQAENTSDRRRQLYDRGLISEEELDQFDLALAQAKGRLIRARTNLDQANTRLDETVVTAPITGVILQKYVEVGQIISSGISNVGGGTAIVDIADMTLLHIEAGIDEIDVGKVRVGQLARVFAEAYPDLTFTGEIIRIAPEAKVVQNVTLFNVVIQVENSEGLLKSGMNSTVEITVVREDNVLLVPTMTLSEPRGQSREPNQRQVLLRQGEEFVPQTVEIGKGDMSLTIIVSGLSEGDLVGVPMTSRLMEDNARMEQRIKSTRSFGSGGSK